MDICILAGGLGSRLAGVWSGPKCLVPVAGVPILARIVAKVIHEIRPANIIISIGSQTKGLEVIQWWCKDAQGPWRNIESEILNVNFAVEPAPLGRLNALVSCLPALTPPILVLNGDTLPRYDLRTLGQEACVAMVRGRPAGAYILDALIVSFIHSYAGKGYDLDTVLACLIERHVQVPGFLDVGTPEGFAEAQQLDAAEG
jgi:hypothetical protein